MAIQQKAQMPLELSCIPIDMRTKRYYWRKWLFVKEHNGEEYACMLFKTLRQVMMSYINDEDRTTKRLEYMKQAPVRINGWLYSLFSYADTQPLHVLQFLKLYTFVKEPVVSCEEAAAAMQQTLDSAEHALPSGIIDCWLHAMLNKKATKELIIQIYLADRGYECYDELLVAFLRPRVLQAKKDGVPLGDVLHQELRYLEKMSKILTPKLIDNEVASDIIREELPTLWSYQRYTGKVPAYQIRYDLSEGLNPLEEDITYLMMLGKDWPQLRIVFDQMPASLVEEVDVFSYYGAQRDTVAGHIRQIPKKGTVVRRPIADPNKYLQAGMRPFQRYLRSITRKIPRNCQFSQTKLNRRIVEEVDHGYAGSVDLHQATDWLPLSWFNQIEAAFYECWYPDYGYWDHEGLQSGDHSVLWDSRDLSMTVARAQWENTVGLASWERGQPLGTCPSFEILTITHFCLLEAICWSIGRLDSPYALLGDDVVFFSQKARESYIWLMEQAGNPLSLSKSYDGRLTEFAGYTFVRNQVPQQCPDISYVNWSNLMDYQRATGVEIPYRALPSEVKARLKRVAQSGNLQSNPRPEDLYRAMQHCTGSPSSAKINSAIGNMIINYFASKPYLNPRDPDYKLKKRALEPEPLRSLYGFVVLGHAGLYDHAPVVQTIKRSHNRKRDWWKRKFRPDSTTAVANGCVRSSSSVQSCT
jgi:hypothetical protein